MNTLRFVIQIVLGIALTFMVQRWDCRRLAPEREARAWNGATWGAALYAFGPLSMVGWAWVTRARTAEWEQESGGPVMLLKSLGLLALGLVAGAVIAMVIFGVDWAIAELIGAPE
ncbi:MAG: transcriptional regulator [Minicystis sp.]